MAKIMLDDREKRKENVGEAIDRLIHNMENELQVISMEAHLQHSSKSEPQCALAAVANIEKLLEEIRQSFLLSR
jgi:hypothetical protein